MINAHQRMFYLMLSAVEGQEFAKIMGFSPPSEDVASSETEDVLTRWAVFLHYGLLKEAEEASEWFTEFLVETDKIISEVGDFKSVLMVYSIALLNKLMDSEKVAFVIPMEGEDE